MVRLRTVELEPGMVTARPVHDVKGRVLCPEGKELSSELIAWLGDRQAPFVFVETPGEEDRAAAEEACRQVEQRLGMVFSAAQDSPEMQALRDQIAAYLHNARGLAA